MTKLQCGWEDECTEDNCLNCPRKYKITIEVTEAELSCVEDFGVADLKFHQEEQPELIELMQRVMTHLMMKMFKETE